MQSDSEWRLVFGPLGMHHGRYVLCWRLRRLPRRRLCRPDRAGIKLGSIGTEESTSKSSGLNSATRSSPFVASKREHSGTSARLSRLPVTLRQQCPRAAGDGASAHPYRFPGLALPMVCHMRERLLRLRNSLCLRVFRLRCVGFAAVLPVRLFGSDTRPHTRPSNRFSRTALASESADAAPHPEVGRPRIRIREFLNELDRPPCRSGVVLRGRLAVQEDQDHGIHVRESPLSTSLAIGRTWRCRTWVIHSLLCLSSINLAGLLRSALSSSNAVLRKNIASHIRVCSSRRPGVRVCRTIC
jgi:hypothetical protein